MHTTDYIIHAVEVLERKYDTRDPYALCECLGIRIRRMDLKKKLKGFFFYQSRIANIVIDSNVNEVLERILIAHELGHAVLHKEIAMMGGFQEMEVFDSTSVTENEANLFCAELLLTDTEVLEQLEERLRRRELPVIGRITREQYILDMRTIRREEFDAIVQAVSEALA